MSGLDETALHCPVVMRQGGTTEILTPGLQTFKHQPETLLSHYLPYQARILGELGNIISLASEGENPYHENYKQNIFVTDN